MINTEQTLIIIKPDGVQKNIIGQIITFFEKENLNIINIKMTKLKKKFINIFYYEHIKKSFFNDLLNFMTSGPIIAIIIQGYNSINKTREIIGHANYKLAKPNTIRYKFANSITKNIIHGSDSKCSAKREIKLFF